MLANVIEYGGETCVIDGAFEFQCSEENIEHLVLEVNQSLLKGEITMTDAYRTILKNIGCSKELLAVISQHHQYGTKIVLENNFWEDEES